MPCGRKCSGQTTSNRSPRRLPGYRSRLQCRHHAPVAAMLPACGASTKARPKQGCHHEGHVAIEMGRSSGTEFNAMSRMVVPAPGNEVMNIGAPISTPLHVKVVPNEAISISAAVI